MGARTSMPIDTGQLIHGCDIALPVRQHEPVYEGREGEEDRQSSRAGFWSRWPVLGRMPLPFLRASLASSLGKSC